MHSKMEIAFPFWMAIDSCCHRYWGSIVISCGTYKATAKVCLTGDQCTRDLNSYRDKKILVECYNSLSTANPYILITVEAFN